jgi:hypothetical protein
MKFILAKLWAADKLTLERCAKDKCMKFTREAR